MVVSWIIKIIRILPLSINGLKIELIDGLAIFVILIASLTYIAASAGDLWFDEVL